MILSLGQFFFSHHQDYCILWQELWHEGYWLQYITVIDTPNGKNVHFIVLPLPNPNWWNLYYTVLLIILQQQNSPRAEEGRDTNHPPISHHETVFAIPHYLGKLRSMKREWPWSLDRCPWTPKVQNCSCQDQPRARQIILKANNLYHQHTKTLDKI